ncbi:hypothetical protein PF005_g16328 [Phytophthora fragariae]|uniref:Uncharacterized protein n=2 Tax=Phytophthora TaxID=4783 RepID=A0A6A3JS14_9STRA|nr:hypothetical protein PF003_g18121 [Phytophthora fragariae]KAE9039937.1 hypothetical protein PR002_g5225 [Phytophthora rubi]KAE8932717.1 hypothetical protein PF009_g17260 [Phytophthora fragariae]KAE8997980.1 hypothetical protein PF011_g15246 [Phytophthora fragariae]KAE9045418.1 hypothetical protein PR001_g4980 [Phytophthora rubi]
MRADPAVSQRLQQAAEQLQAAIQSARKRRHSRDGVGQSPGGKSWRLAPTVMLAPEHEESDGEEDGTDSAQQQSSDNEADSAGTSLASGSRPQSPTKGWSELRDTEVLQESKLEMDSVEQEMRKALDWMQRDVERQARENRAVRETLARSILDVTDIIADFVSPNAASLLLRTAAAATGTSPEEVDNNAATPQLIPDKVDELVVQWEDALVAWREQSLVAKQELMEAFTTFEAECMVRMQAGEASHKSEQEQLAHDVNAQQMFYEDCMSSLSSQLEQTQREVQSLQAQVSGLSSLLATTNVQAKSCDATTDTIELEFQGENLQQQVLELSARVKSAEMFGLQCEASLREQTQRADEAESRLSILHEECQELRMQPSHARTSAAPNDALQSYQQKLELLEGRMQDVLQQVACDHEQYEYEQAKWALEKRHHREKYDEVLDASVKVLKVLIIREKLMKKHERVQKRQSEECQDKQLELACHVASLQGMTNELMQLSAMVLLVLQQLAVLKANASVSQDAPARWTLPAKPVQMKSMIKRLKKIEAALGRRDWASATPSMQSLKVCPYTYPA